MNKEPQLNREPQRAGRGALAQVIATRGGLAAPEAPFVIEHREALIYMLCQAAELEHAIMCQYLYAAFSLKRRADEGLSDTEIVAVERWRQTISHIATQEMLHLALVQNMLSAVGGAPHLSRPNLPQPAGHYPPGVVLALIPFGEAALQHFMYLERPEGMDLADAAGLASAQRSAPLMAEGEIVPRLQDFATVGHLYRSIEEGFKHLSAKYGEQWLFVAHPSAQANEEDFGWSDLVQVTDAASAQRAVDTILEQGEGPRGHWRSAHFGQFVEVLDDYLQFKQANPGFEPARPVLPATVRPCEGDRVTPIISDPFSAKCTDLFNIAYEILLLTLQRYFVHTEESAAELGSLAKVTLGLMFKVIKPMGELITELPVGDEHPGRTAGPSFELFYESDYVLPHRDAAWALIEERLREASSFADRLRSGAPGAIALQLAPVGAALLDLAHVLAAQRERWGGRSHAGEVTLAHRRSEAQAARLVPGVRQQVDVLVSTLGRAIGGVQAGGLGMLVAATSLKADAVGDLDDLDDDQLSLVRSWRRGLLSQADRQFQELSDLAELLVAVNGESTIDPSPLPAPPAPPGSQLPNAEWIEWLRGFERPDLAATCEEIKNCLITIPAGALIIDPQPSSRGAAASGERRPASVVDQPSALTVINSINSGAAESAHPPQSAEPPTLLDIIEQLAVDRAGGFEAVRPGALGRIRIPLSGSGLELAREGLAGQVARLLADCHEILLAILGTTASTQTDPIGAGGQLRATSNRLWRSVLRPLAETLAQELDDPPAAARSGPAPPAHPPQPGLADRLRAAALDAANTLAQSPDAPAELAEATAALQDVAATFASTDDASASVFEDCRKAQSGMAANVRLVKNGPYVVTNVEHFSNWLGEPIAAGPTVALCRCGASAAKPFCDGSHARTDFSGGKDPSRVPDRRDSYDGIAVTVFDNRGICQHSGYCSDALSSAFRANEEPFVAPSGAPIGEIVRAVRACPSGALSFAIDGHEARDIVDWHGERQEGILITKDGPYRVTGGVPLLDETGQPVARNDGASLEHYAMCRCGHSQNKPFCSGMHWYIGFRDPVPDAEPPPTLFEWCGGLPALTRMTRLFYERFVPEDPLLAPLFADMTPDHPERVAKWLGEVFGGPASYSDGHGGYAHMLSRHAGANLSEDQRSRWVELLCRSGSESGLPSEPEFWSAFRSYLEWGSRVVLDYSNLDGERPPVTSSPRWDWGPPGPPPKPSTQSDKDEPANESAMPPGEGDPVSFGAHIKVLFREHDHQSMSFAFDLWSYEDVRAHAKAIAGRLSAGTMPCDGAWPAEKTDLFRRWIDEGMPA